MRQNKQVIKHTIEHAFSMVELMVVIAIIGILAAISIPAYKINVVKSKIGAGVPIGMHALKIATEYYDAHGFFPTSLTVYDQTIAAAQFVYINMPPVMGIFYNYYPQYNSSHVCVYFSDIGVPGYSAPTGNNHYFNRICMNAIMYKEAWKKSCGIWGGGETMDIPIQYLPSGCNCDFVNNVAVGGASCNH